MIPVKLQISGFLSYQEPVEVDFTGFNLACISGTNGAGKSSLLDAITWVLFGNARRNDDSIINSHEETARVMLVFLYEGETYRVTREKHRNKTGTLEFNIQTADGGWNILTGESIRMTEARICDTLKMQYETFINASFFLQGKADQFAQQKPADRKRILGTILGLEKWETYQAEASNRRKQVKSEMDSLEGRMADILTELGEEEQRKQKLAETEASRDQTARQRAAQETALQGFERLESALMEQKRAFERMENERQSAVTRREQMSIRLRDRQVEIAADQALLKDEAQIEERYKQWEATRLEKEKLEALAVRFRHLDAQRQSPMQQIAAEKGRLEQELSNLTSLQNEGPAVNRELDTLAKSLLDTKTKLDGWQSIVETRPVVESDRQAVVDSIAQLDADNKRLKISMDELRERMDQLQAAAGADCPLCGQPLTMDHRQELLSSLEQEGKSLADTYRGNLQTIKQKTEEKTGLETRLKECDQATRLLQDGQRAYDQMLNRQSILLQKQEEQKSAAGRAGEIREVLQNGRFAVEHQTAIKGIAAEIESLGFDAAQLDRLTLQETQLRPVNEQRQLIGQAKARLEPLQRETVSLQQQLNETEVEITRREADLEKARLQLEEHSAGLPDLTALRSELNDLRKAETRLISEAGAARQQVQVLDTLRERQKELTDTRLELSRQMDRYKALERAFGKDGVQALLIEEALPEIETQANEILDRLSGGSMSVQFATQKDYKDKNREDKRETLDIIITDETGSDRAYELFSGGEAFRVNFAIRLALSQVLAHRAGARLQTLVIDEGFGSQDMDGRQRLIETINIVRQSFAKILVITHLEELKDAFPARIEVEKTALHGSMVTVTL
jgi:DNA repair protein SbcC/Rad50